MKKQAKQTAGKATGPKKAIKKKVFRGGIENDLPLEQFANLPNYAVASKRPPKHPKVSEAVE
jgi:hypothetical protein